jgi:hypothetical protein
MLTAYDWAFVEQAKELRGYAVAQILEEVKHPDARIRLKALQMLGTVTEVALFTERVEVKKETMSDKPIAATAKQLMSPPGKRKQPSASSFSGFSPMNSLSHGKAMHDHPVYFMHMIIY